MWWLVVVGTFEDIIREPFVQFYRIICGPFNFGNKDTVPLHGKNNRNTQFLLMRIRLGLGF